MSCHSDMLMCSHSRRLVAFTFFFSHRNYGPSVCLSVCLSVCIREKYTLEQDIRDTEEAIRHKSAEVQVCAPCSLVSQL